MSGFSVNPFVTTTPPTVGFNDLTTPLPFQVPPQSSFAPPTLIDHDQRQESFFKELRITPPPYSAINSLATPPIFHVTPHKEFIPPTIVHKEKEHFREFLKHKPSITFHEGGWVGMHTRPPVKGPVFISTTFRPPKPKVNETC